MSEAFQEDINELKAFKVKHQLKEMVVHIHELTMANPYWAYVSDAMEKLIPGVKQSYMIGDGDFETGMFPLVTNHSLYLIELENNGEESLKQIEYYKKRVLETKGKLSSTKFLEKAPVEIVALEKKRLSDFEGRWERASIGYMFI